MNFVVTLLQDVLPYLHTQSILGRISWLIFLLVIILFLLRMRRFNPPLQPSSWALLFTFIIISIVSSLFVGFEIPLEEPLPLKGQIGSQHTVTWMLFSQVAVIFSAGFLGPFGASIVGGISGLIYAYFETHNTFTVLEFLLLGGLFGIALHQRYRTRFFRAISSPFVLSLLLSLAYPIVHFTGVILWLDDPLSERVDYAIRLIVPVWIAVGGSLFVGGLSAELVSRAFPQRWGNRRPLIPSPAEESIETRSFTLMGLVVAGLAILLSVIGWFAASESAMGLVENRVSGTAALVADNVPAALEVGQNLILTHARDPLINTLDPGELQNGLAVLSANSVYFQHLIIADADGAVITEAGDPGGNTDALFPAEGAGVELASAGVPFQYYASVIPEPNPHSILSFIAPVPDSGSILIGRSVFDENPFTAPLLISLGNLQGLEGSGILLDDNLVILYHPVASMIGNQYSGELKTEGGFANGIASDGSQVLTYAEPLFERSWMIVIEVPVRVVQREALSIAGPLVGLLLALAFVSVLLLRLILRVVTGSLRNLSVEANRIAENPVYLDTPLQASGVDEVGVMRTAFDRMRVSLKSRLDEQRQLLLASHGAASSLDFNSSVKPLLNAALAKGAASARVVLTAGALPTLGFEDARIFYAGTRANQYSYLDSQILHLNKEKNPLVIQKPISHKELRFLDGKPIPLSILAIPLAQEKQYFGSLWIAYHRPHVITEDEIRFMSTLGAQGALAVANARLYMGAEVGKERLEAILTATPDPVIVTDQNGNLLLANPASWIAFGDGLKSGRGKPIADHVQDQALINLLTTRWEGTHSTEITAGDNIVFVAKATSVKLRNQGIGTVCVMRDVTLFKELDEMKSEFVESVSHDLRSPLQIIKSYATMISAIEEVSDTQMVFVDKITHSVDRMSKLVDDMLHLGRFEVGFDLALEQVSPTAVVSSVTESMNLLAKQKNVSLTPEIGSVVGMQFEADQLFIERALTNLVENAIKYSNPGGRVVLSVEKDEHAEIIHFSVADSGIGISPDDQERLFERFFRAKDRLAQKQSGSGLGLAIVKSIVERHHGQARVDSTKGTGSKFTISIPLKQPVD